MAKRRDELGLTREEVAARAGMATSHLRFIEEQSTAAPGPGTMGTLAAVLDTTVTALSGGEADLPPGRRGRASPHARLVELSPGECRARLDGHGVGRIAVTTPGHEAVLPVNYSVVDRSVVFRTAPGSGPAQAVGTEVVFEVDHVDEALSQGWSVLVRGPARRVEARRPYGTWRSGCTAARSRGTTTASCGSASTWTPSAAAVSTSPDAPAPSPPGRGRPGDLRSPGLRR
ncbi:pyridoxamine 5'-phosphate oxidase family protein [Actinacidiphila glaucinigra]|uniref:pyridoxamine 5'-phosphate oxidase family protein n=1 Tax=Actinacidiphila glaucinigra TaxID=235986 RepID=UPI0029AC075F|nr:pyridoxamine 5'-phosphate oxidase family protein [Streptomyces sp. PA03-3a]